MGKKKGLKKAVKYDIELDVTGISCPMPILRVSDMMKSMNKNEVIRVIASDGNARGNFTAFAKATGNKILDLQEAEGLYTFLIKKTKA